MPLQAPRTPPRIFKPIFHVPYERNPHFAGRDELLETIRYKIQDALQKGYKHRIALYGLGGVGKTQIALEYCYRYDTEYDYVFWMSAVDQTRLLSSFREVATLIGSKEIASNQTPEDVARAVLRWLQSKEKWLMLFDNLDDIYILKGYLPLTHSSGHVLITTRNKNCDGIPAEGVEITPMNSYESVSLLLIRSRLQDDPREEVKLEAENIVNELGHLPLAIEQAAAYIRSSQNIFEYLSTFRQNRKHLLHDKPQGNYPYQESVATTWKMSFDRLAAINPSSIKLIQLLAFMNPDEILIEFLKAGNTGVWPELKSILNNDFFLRQSLRDLECYSLVRVWDDGRKTTIHRLVQSVIRDDLGKEFESLLASQAIQLGLSAFPDTVEGTNRQICRVFRSQVMAILANVENHRTGFCSLRESASTWLTLAARLTFYLFHDGYYSDALKLDSDCVEIRKRVLGPEHPDTLQSLGGLAAIYNRLGRPNEALKVNEECLEIRRGCWDRSIPRRWRACTVWR